MKNFKIAGKLFSLLLLVSLTIVSGCKKDDPDDENNNNNNNQPNKVLIIENGAQSVTPDQSVAFSAILIDEQGNITSATGVSWSLSDSGVGSISTGGSLTIAATGNITVTATATVDGQTYTASVPLRIYTPTLFAVAPSAIIYETGGSIQLETVYFSATGTNPSYTFTSSSSSIASVNSSGLVQFVAAGSCVITVTANLDGSPTFEIPVLVIAPPVVALPVIRVDVNPPSKDLFRNETQQLTATAYDGDGVVTGKTFTWTSLDASIASVDANGLVTPVNVGSTFIQAVTDGIMGQSEIIVNPDTLIIVSPYYVSVPAGNTKQFTATAYHLTRTSATQINGINFTWMIPTYGFSMFDIASVNSSGLVTMKSDAIMGMMTMVIAYDQNNQNNGGAAILVAAIADPCDCGVGNANVSSISVSNGSTVNMSVMNGPVQLNVLAKDLQGNNVNNPQLVYCSDNSLVVNVDANGELVPVGEGTATVKICSGSYAETTVTVNVTLF